MSSIKPPGSLSDAPAATEAAAVESSGRAEAPRQSEPAAQPVEAAVTPDAIAQIATAVGEGALTVDQAIERLVERAMGPVVSQLSEAERDELVALLRDALANDPALVSLRDSLR